MNVGELIEELRKYSAHTTVVVSGYEGGVTEELMVGATFIHRDANEGDYYGEHESTDEVTDQTVVLIARTRGAR